MDEVSLRSLLASQIGALTNEITELLSRADEAEISSSLSARAPLLGSDIASRYNTTNSRGSQTSRKSVVQSLFKEFRELPSVRILLQPPVGDHVALNVADVFVEQSEFAVKSSELARGSLIEVEVELVADPIFRISTILSELSEISDEFPEKLIASQDAAAMAQAGPINRVLQRMLAGLIPLRARAVDLVMVRHDGREYVVRAEAASQLGLETSPIYVVGVTEHLSYWRDVRRVLFTGARFTMLCRVSRDGLHGEWAPVKLADVLAEVVPTFSGLVDGIGKLADKRGIVAAESKQQIALRRALSMCLEAATRRASVELDESALEDMTQQIASSAGAADTAAGQRAAFGALSNSLQRYGVKFTPEEWLEIRRKARAEANLVLFQDTAGSAEMIRPDGEVNASDGRDAAVLLDTEVIAIYW